MMREDLIISKDTIKDKIYTIRGKQVILDCDIASFYKVRTKILNQAVKRNKKRFPEKYMFQLTKKEFENLRSQFVTAKSNTSKRRFLPYVFTEQGIAMLSGVLRSKSAINISILIMDTFVTIRHFLIENANIFQKFQQIDQKLIEHDENFNKVFQAIENKDIKPKQGIFFDGQIFDAYKFVSDLIKMAKKSLILIDNYIDDSTLTLFSKSNAKIAIYTKNISKQLKLDLEKYNSQYKPILIKEFNNSHDRFIIIDDNQVYHFGASLKDLGKKWFAFSKLDKEAFKLLERLKSP